MCLCDLALQVEEGTPFARWYTGENSPLPREPDAVAMFELASALLTGAGYEHYEVWIRYTQHHTSDAAQICQITSRALHPHAQHYHTKQGRNALHM